MSQKELFEARVHAMACAYIAADLHRDVADESIVRMSIASVRAVDAALAEILHAEEPAPTGSGVFGYATATAGAELRAGELVTVYPAEPLGWRSMSAFAEAKSIIVIADNQSGVFTAHANMYEFRGTELAWLQLPPMPTVKP